MRYIGINILLVLCLTLLLFTGCKANAINPEVEEPVIEEDTEATAGTVYPQQWATGDGTAENPWANDCIQKAYDFVPDGGTIFLKTGYYELSAALGIFKQINIIGEDRNATIIKTANERGFVVRHDNCTLKGFTIDGDSQTDGTQYLSCISISNCDYISLEDIEVKNAGYYGVEPYQVNYSLFQNIYAHDNFRHGLHPGSDTTGRNKYNTYRNIYAWDNGVDGFSDRGSTIDPDTQFYNVFDNLQCWDNGRFGIDIDNQRGGVLSNSFTSGNEEHGIWLYNVEDLNIHDCYIDLSGKEGLDIKLSKNVTFTNVIVKNNNVSGTDGICGVIINNSSGINFTSCQSYDDRAISLQAYGIQLEGTNTGISILNCKLTPNKYGEIYNPTGVVITEKRGFLPLSL